MTVTQIGAVPDADVRTFVAREVHDRIGSGLALVLRRLDLLEHAPPGRPDLRRSRLDEARAALAEALGATRALVADLRGAPPGGATAAAPVPSLEAALRGYLRAAAPTGTAVRLRVRGDEGRLPAPVRGEVAVVVREALRNALAHARAETVSAVVTVTPEEVRAVVRDDGAGFDPAAVRRPGRAAGLLAMEERAAGLGGTATVASAPGHGTEVVLRIPLGAPRGGRGDGRG